ncbi:MULTISPECIES: Shedu immune nuclease family protein [Mesonia]|uniref:Uncharacterized protein n=1 Tax=Mesonia oceanica TaxID=2687242 RepID=A0AC61Y9R7_9FLAO|nr:MULTISPECIES: Shedu immune nuclease family protein [Mesonia]MAN28209.1 hypothetical protein [Mesonia sp.]MBJ96818.1 hypothetical protein [Flavobacteriaceae bacterium]VVV00940.1 hypothetical protein FVB9532_02216 [Mesonia oceanica]
MTTIQKNEKKLILKYVSDYAPADWMKDNLENEEEFTFKSVFNLHKEILEKHISEEDIDEDEFQFVIGKLEDGYYKIDKDVLGLENDFYFFKDLDITLDYFLFPGPISILKKIDNKIKQAIYIGGDKEDILPSEVFEKLLKNFPNSYEINLYREAKITAILGDYFAEVPDYEEKFNNYINKKTAVRKNILRKTFKQSEIAKYRTLLEKLNYMLNNDNNYSENQWQEDILQIILLLFPKYIAVFTEVRFKDIYSSKFRRLDYGLIDFNGNLDLIEIKKPFDKNIVSKIKYRDNHVPNKDLSGAIMQIEKYIYYLNKLGKKGEKKLTKKYKKDLPEGLTIKIVNPIGMIIMGRDKTMEPSELGDFEIIKRKYKNVIDIFTYDDLLRRLEVTIKQLKKI